MKRRSGIGVINILFIVVIIMMLLAGFGASFADDGSGLSDEAAVISGVAGGGYEVTSYDMNVTVGKDHSYTVSEMVTVNVPDTLQRIDFSIPSGSFRIRNINVEGMAFAAKTAQAGSYVTILDPEGLSVGLHTYDISYTIYEFADRDQTKDIFYFSVLLPEWRQPIAELKIKVDFPEDFPWDGMHYYSGQYGVQDTENRLTIEEDRSSSSVTITGKKIPENFGITLKSTLEEGYWAGALDGIWAIFAMVIAMGLVTLVMFIMWLIGGRDPKIRRMPQTRPIENLSSSEFGYVFNSRMDIRDIVRLIIDFGIKGYLRIEEYEPKRYRLVRLSDPDGEAKHIRNAYNILFEDIYKGRAVDMDQLGGRLVRIENAIRDDVAAGFSSSDMLAYTPLSKGFRIAGIIMTALGMAATNALKYSYQYIQINYGESLLVGLGTAILLGLICRADDIKYSSSDNSGKVTEIILAILYGSLTLYLATSIARQTGHYVAAVLIAVLAGFSAFLAVIMRARGRGNAELMMRMRQLRRFIYRPSPKEVLENYLEDNNYYYNMMLYALTFGAEESWAISFLTLDVPEPEWYRDEIEGHAFSNLREKPAVTDYARDFRSFVRTIESAYSDIKPQR